MVVDSVRGEKLSARLNISVLAIPCPGKFSQGISFPPKARILVSNFFFFSLVLALNTLDQSGNFNFNLQQDLLKEVLDPSGNPIGVRQDELESESAARIFGASSPLFLTDEDKVRIKESITRKEGCRISGKVVLQKVSGTFHLSSNALILQLLIEVREREKNIQHNNRAPLSASPFLLTQAVQAFDGLQNVNTSHIIHEVALGEPYPESINPLDHYHRITTVPGSYKYYLKVVPTEYVYLNRTTIHTFQYSVTEYFTNFGTDNMKLPGIHFKYDMSAIAVKLRESKVSFLHFMTRLCATIGGAFALTSMANSWVDRLLSRIR